jgi:two-component system, response regulator YesN
MRIAIADDEEMARFMIRSLLEESVASEPIEVVAEARNGEELLDSLERSRPDLAFVDIRMPQMNGLEAIRLGRERFPEVAWVILTSYSEFEYAREAIKLGAIGYLLKPTRPEDLAELLERAAAEIERRWRERNASTLSAIAIAHFLSEDRMVLSRSSRNRKWRGSIFAFDGPEGANYGAEEARLKAACEGRCIRRGYGQIFLPTKLRNFLVAIDGDELPRAVARPTSSGGPAITALCFESMDFAELCGRLSEWDRLLGLRLVLGLGREYSVSALESLPEDLLAHAEACSVFSAALRAADCAEALKALELLERAMGRAPDGARRAALREYAAVVAGSPPAEGEDPIAILRRLCESRIRAASGPPDIVAEVVAFVDRHYTENLGVSVIAERLGISANYLSTIFHKRTGQKLVSYVAGQRMLHAKRLLLENPSMPVAKVAALVGHSDSRYFAQQFLRYAGCYPSQYRKMSR